MEGNGLGDDATEVIPFLGSCVKLDHDVVSSEDIVGHVPCICVDVVDIAIIVFLDAVGWDDTGEVETRIYLVMGAEQRRTREAPEAGNCCIALD